MILNEDPGQDNSYLLGPSELQRWTDPSFGQHRAAAYATFGSGIGPNDAIPSHVTPYWLAGMSRADWCASPEFKDAQGQLCRLDSRWCPGSATATCAAITTLIETTTSLFTRDNGRSDAIRIACQCQPNGKWDGCCQNGLPCSAGGVCTPNGGNCSSSATCCSGNCSGGTCQATGGIDTTTLLLVGGGAAVLLTALFILTGRS